MLGCLIAGRRLFPLFFKSGVVNAKVSKQVKSNEENKKLLFLLSSFDVPNNRLMRVVKSPVFPVADIANIFFCDKIEY